jgi:alkanesulfonate monooxygenase SsuD/methylene tetrahydromethanopterin reductase-like flavin-dependent oxidoreductase (luciferase family)
MDLAVRVGVVILPATPWSEQRHDWRRAEELGFAHAWTYDHLSWRSFRDSAWFGAVPTLAAAALETSRIRIGPLVASPNFRHPVPFAKELVTLDDISGGRFTLGIGAGGVGWDATMLGHDPWSPSERSARFAEFVALTDLLLRSPATTHTGEYYAADEARTYPGCVQQPRVPFAIAAIGRRGMRVAARFGETWVTTGDQAGDGSIDAKAGAAIVAEQIARLSEICASAGRDPSTIGRLVHLGPELDPGLGSPEQFRDTAGRYADAGVTDLVVPWPRPDDPYRADLATFEEIFTS